MANLNFVDVPIGNGQFNASGLSFLTFNMLAPCYKRLHDKDGCEMRERERDRPLMWKSRVRAQLALLLSISPAPDVVALQEIWFDAEYIAMLENALSPHYYIFYGQHPSPKQDGLATLIHRRSPFITPLTDFNPCVQSEIDADNSIDAPIHAVRTDAVSGVAAACGRKARRTSVAMAAASAMALNESVVFPLLDNGDRAALAVTVALTSASCGVEKVGNTHSTSPAAISSLLILNSHLTFPHTRAHRERRDCEARSLVSFARTHVVASAMTPPDDLDVGVPCGVLVAGDFNADHESLVNRTFRKAGYRNCYTYVNGNSAYPVTHRNHRLQSVFVDHVFLLSLPRSSPRRARLRGTAVQQRFRRVASQRALAGAGDLVTEAGLMASRRSASMLRFDDSHFDGDPHSDVDELVVTPCGPGMGQVEDEGGEGMRNASGVVVHHDSDHEHVQDGLHNVPLPRHVLEPLASSVYPESLATDVWPISFCISDHRPVGIQFVVKPL